MLQYDAVSEIFTRITESRSVMSNSLRPHGLYSLWNSPGQNTGVGSLSLLQGIIPTRMISCIKSDLVGWRGGGRFPGGSEVKNLPCNARDRLDPWSSNILHATEQLSLCTTTTKPVLQSPGLQLCKPVRTRAPAPRQEKPPQWEAHAPRLESSPRCLQLEKSPHSNKDPAQPKINTFLKRYFSDLVQDKLPNLNSPMASCAPFSLMLRRWDFISEAHGNYYFFVVWFCIVS